MLVLSGIFMFGVIGGISLLSHYYTLKVAYADKQEIEEKIIRRYMCCMEEEVEQEEPARTGRNGGMQQTQVNETMTRVRQPLRT